MAKNSFATSPNGSRLDQNFMLRLSVETREELEALAGELKVTPTTLARMLVLFGLTRKEEFKEKVKL